MLPHLIVYYYTQFTVAGVMKVCNIFSLFKMQFAAVRLLRTFFFWSSGAQVSCTSFNPTYFFLNNLKPYLEFVLSFFKTSFTDIKNYYMRIQANFVISWFVELMLALTKQVPINLTHKEKPWMINKRSKTIVILNKSMKVVLASTKINLAAMKV